MVVNEHSTDAYAWPAGLWVRANLVATDTGQTSGPSGTSSDLTSAEDRRLLRQIRRDCDALIVGAASIRAEGWHLPPRGQTHIVSRGTTLPWDACPDPSRVTEWKGLPQERLSHLLGRVVSDLASNGVESILCEGGVATVRALAQENLLNELCLTVRGTALGDVEQAMLGILLDGSEWSMTRMLASEDGTTIFSIWRCATGVHS